MGRAFLKFRLLLWKNYLIQKRKPISTLFEIGLPTLFSLILMVLRLTVDSTPHDEATTWPPCPYRDLAPQLAKMKLAYTPNNEATLRLMTRVKSSLNITGIDGFPNEDNMVDFIVLVNSTGGQRTNNSEIYLGGVVFKSKYHFLNDTQYFDKKVEYRLRFSYAPRLKPRKSEGIKGDTSWSTNFMFPTYQIIGPREDGDHCNGNPGYKREGFLAVQHAINDAFMKEFLTKDAFEKYRKTELQLQRHPYPPYKEDNYVLVLQTQFPMVLMLSLVVIVLGIVRDIVLEKERRLKESMKMMGINNWLHWVAWFTKQSLFLLISVIIMTLFYCVPLDSDKGGVISETHPLIVFIYLISYALATITFCFAVSTIFKKANTGAAVGGILFFCLYIPYFFLEERYLTMSINEKISACFNFQLAMAFGGNVMSQFEAIGSGVQFSSFGDGPSVDDDFSMLLVVMLLLIDSCVHVVIAWYIEAVFPGEYGVPRPWYFPFQLSYWGCRKEEIIFSDTENVANVGQNPEMFEKEPNEPAGIKIRNLRKVYGKGEKQKVAVAGMNLNMYEGQITALLGHNGAGKTTTMSILSGFYPPTSGTAIINGYDIRGQIDDVRSSLGLCPQHDILFDNLTVEEHMIFFGLLKGVPKSEIMPASEEMLRDMDLIPKLKTKSKALSGGMKRKLSVCIALIGNSKIVFLDEPSSGLDPNARRSIWTVLQKNRVGRTMILSTHFMDEADVLGDRIAIMADGVVKCYGSSLFLKKKYGAGYHMVVVKEPDCQVNKVIEFVLSHIRHAEVESNVGAELSFILPQESVSSFAQLFYELEEKKESLGINSFGASVTTMEEVFLKVGEESDATIKQRLQHQVQAKPINTPVSSKSSDEDSDTSPLLDKHKTDYGAVNSGYQNPEKEQTQIVLDLSTSANWSSSVLNLSKRLKKNSGSKLFMQQFWAMFHKRVVHTLRNKLVTITQLVVPLFFTLMGLIVLKTMSSLTDMPALDLEDDEFDHNYIPYSYGNLPVNFKMASAYSSFLSQSDADLINVNKEPGYTDNPDLVKYLIQEGDNGLGRYNLRYMLAATFGETNSTNSSTKVTAYYNNQAFHSIAISLAAIFNGMLQYFSNSSDFKISTANEPLPRLAANKIKDQQEGFKDPEGFSISFNLSFGMAFLASSFVLFLVKERSIRAKHIQFVSGVHPVNFWLSTLSWDIINYIVPCIAIIINFFIFSLSNLTDDFRWLQVLLLFFLYGWAMLPYMYLFSFAFTVPSTAYVWITMFNILTGVATLLVVIILNIPNIDMQDLAKALEWVFMIFFPNFSLSQGLYDLYQNCENLKICKPFIDTGLCEILKLMNITNGCCPGNCGDTFCLDHNSNYLGWAEGGIGRMLVFLTIQGIILWAFIFLIEFGYFQKLRYWVMSKTKKQVLPPGVYSSQLSRESLVQEDEDVAKERSLIDNTGRLDLLRNNKLVLDNLTKYYGHFLAVDHLSVAIPPGECFGLLGNNGAGKTTTFKMLTGDHDISSGEAFLDAYSMKSQTKQARKKLGYCPQFDALIGQLTGRETLTLFARLRGIVEHEIPEAVESLMSAMTLTQYADKQSQTYSGGNKRKLSTAIALIGDPEVIFLDEPTTGMDPVARRMLWEVLSLVRDSGRTLVLTSHSMEECEALCTRLAIMVNGQFKCLGSVQHLKTKFGEGYTLNAKISYPADGSEPDLSAVREFMETSFPSSVLTDIHENMVNYHIKDTSLKWAEVFEKIESAKERLQIEDYLVSQTSLEQVFIYFARLQVHPDEGRARRKNTATEKDGPRQRSNTNYSRMSSVNPNA